jgi:hypothetical protein
MNVEELHEWGRMWDQVGWKAWDPMQAQVRTKWDGKWMARCGTKCGTRWGN